MTDELALETIDDLLEERRREVLKEVREIAERALATGNFVDMVEALAEIVELE